MTRILGISPRAYSLRSHSYGWATMMFDRQHLAKMRTDGLNCVRACMQQSPKLDFNKLRRWAGRGYWLAIQSTPEILDSDGVPGLDLVIRPNSRINVAKPPKAPKVGDWNDPVSGLLDLPTGELIIAYEQEFFEAGYVSEFPIFDATDRAIQRFDNHDYLAASTYQLMVVPGFYQVHAFTRDINTKTEVPAGIADLAVFLTPIPKPKSFRMSNPLLPFRHPKQTKARRRTVVAQETATGKPPRPTQLSADAFTAHFLMCFATGGGMDLPRKLRNKLKLKAGLVATLEFGDCSVRGLVASSKHPRPNEWRSYKAAVREHGDLATFEICNETLVVILPPKIMAQCQPGGSFEGKLTVECDGNGERVVVETGR